MRLRGKYQANKTVHYAQAGTYRIFFRAASASTGRINPLSTHSLISREICEAPESAMPNRSRNDAFVSDCEFAYCMQACQ